MSACRRPVRFRGSLWVTWRAFRATEASAPGTGDGDRLAPGRDGVPLKLPPVSTPSRHGPGRLWPWREGRVVEEWKNSDGSVTGVRRECARRAPEDRVSNGQESVGLVTSTWPKFPTARCPGPVFRGSKSTPQVDDGTTRDPGPVPRGSKWSPYDHFEPREPADRSALPLPGRGTVTEVRLRNVPVTPLPRTPHVPGLLMGVTACQDPHEEPRTISDGRRRPGPPPVPTPPARTCGAASGRCPRCR